MLRKNADTQLDKERESEREAVTERGRGNCMPCHASIQCSAHNLCLCGASFISANAARRQRHLTCHRAANLCRLAKLSLAGNGRERERPGAGDSCRLPGSLICSAHTEHMSRGKFLNNLQPCLGQIFECKTCTNPLQLQETRIGLPY